MSSHEQYQDFPPYRPIRLVFVIAWLAAFAGALWILGEMAGVN